MAIDLDVAPAMMNGNGIAIAPGMPGSGAGKRAAAGNGHIEKPPLHDDYVPTSALLRPTATATTTATSTATAAPVLVQPSPLKASINANGDVESGNRSPSPPTPKYEAGRQPDSVYAERLAPWRDSFRRWCVRKLGPESERIARFQSKYRTPARDKFFFYSAIFGTHTFFTAFLPVLFWLGYPDEGRILLFVVGIGIYFSCVLKDVACTPRPYAPPVTRLSISTHHREYGFPSSHSTNSISIALFMGQMMWERREWFGMPTVLFGWTVLFLYYASVAGGRIYCGMHSSIDVIGGTLLGIICWMAQVVGKAIVDVVETGSWWTIYIGFPLTLALIHFHPRTPDDCPCFEDAVAIISVLFGATVGHVLEQHISPPPGSGVWSLGIFWGIVFNFVKVAGGLAAIVVWRLIAKPTCLRIFPVIFRAVSKAFDTELPHRPFYTPATSYKGGADAPIRPVPSFAELPHVDSDVNLDVKSSSRRSPSPMADEGGIQMRHRAHKGADMATLKRRYDPVAGNSHRGRRASRRKRYDAEVLTKFVVYTGIGIVAGTLTPYVARELELAYGLP